MADELIRLDTTIIGIDSLINKASTAEEAKVLFAVKDVIYSQQRYSTDAKLMKRGRWIETHISLCKWIPEDEKEEGHSFYMAEMKCSCCERYNTQTFSLTLNKPDFCQHCGARMIKDGDTE